MTKFVPEFPHRNQVPFKRWSVFLSNTITTVCKCKQSSLKPQKDNTVADAKGYGLPIRGQMSHLTIGLYCIWLYNRSSRARSAMGWAMFCILSIIRIWFLTLLLRSLEAVLNICPGYLASAQEEKIVPLLQNRYLTTVLMP